MLKIRLERVGKKRSPSFRIVVTDSRNAMKSGKALEVLGSFDYRSDRNKNIRAERIKHWLSHGAKLSDSIHNLLINEKVIEGKKINVLPKKSPPKKEESKPAPPPEASSPTPPASPGEKPKAETPGQ